MRKFIILMGVCIFCVFGIAATVNAQTRDYMTRETVEKTGSSTVYTNSTGTNIYSVFYGGTCTSGNIDLVVQGYNGDWVDLTFPMSVNSGNSDSGTYTDPSYTYKIYRLKVSGFLGRGSGYIQGR